MLSYFNIYNLRNADILKFTYKYYKIHLNVIPVVLYKCNCRESPKCTYIAY